MKNYKKFIKESFDNDLKSADKSFLELTHLYELEIRFNFIESYSISWTEALVYIYNNDIIFYDAHKDNILVNDIIYKRFYNYKNMDIDILNTIIDKYFHKKTNTLSTTWIKDHKNNWL